jgi:hypothetical protein
MNDVEICHAKVAWIVAMASRLIRQALQQEEQDGEWVAPKLREAVEWLAKIEPILIAQEMGEADELQGGDEW